MFGTFAQYGGKLSQCFILLLLLLIFCPFCGLKFHLCRESVIFEFDTVKIYRVEIFRT